jgi:lysozyme
MANLHRTPGREGQQPEHASVPASAVILVLVLLLAAACSQKPEVPKLDKMTPGVFLEEGALPEGARALLRTLPDQGIALTEDSEGFVPTLYDDAANYCSIAFGHLIKKSSCNGTEPGEFLRGVSREQGTALLKTDMGRAQYAVSSMVAVVLSDGQYGALCDFVYNVGGTNFRSSTLRKVINARQFDSVPPQFRRWTMAGGVRQPGLVKRREREIELFFGAAQPPSRGLEAPLPPVDIRVGEQG